MVARRREVEVEGLERVCGSEFGEVGKSLTNFKGNREVERSISDVLS